MAGGAALHTARALREKVLEVASHLLEASVDDLEIVDGAVGVRGVPVSAKPLADDRRRGGAEPDACPKASTARLEVDEELRRRRRAAGPAARTAPSSRSTSRPDSSTIERYVVVEDCGELINPAIVDGQVRGGVAQGIGAVLLERSAYDPRAGSSWPARSWTTCCRRRPRCRASRSHHLETVPLDPDVNFRGVGEGGMIVSPATLCNAIEDALSPFGVKVDEQHLPPLRILELIGALD